MVKICRNLTSKERIHLYQLLLKDFDGKKLKRGSMKKQAKYFLVSTRTVSRIWKMGSTFIARGSPVDVHTKRLNHVGRNKINIDPEKVKLLDLRRCKTLRGVDPENRSTGTMETKDILSVTKEITRAWLIDKVLPAIRDKWPSSSRELICNQQDNARPHIHPSDKEFVEASRVCEFNIELKCQPANSSELNVLDLGFFRAIQSLQYKEAPKNIDELVFSVEKSFNELSPKALNRVFLNLQQVMTEVL